jgi:uncharacterized membrane protein
MNKTHQRLSSALATAVALGLTTVGYAHADSATGKEKCYGVVKAGKNSCANLTDTHSCAGQSTKDNDPSEWTLVPKGSCAKMGGMNAEKAKEAIKLASAKTSGK